MTAGAPDRSPLLEIDGLRVAYGAVTALHDLSLRVEAGEAVALIGANGAGKSTLFKTIVGFLEPRAGRLRLDGRELGRLPPERRFRLGIGYAPEGRRVFPGLSVRENLEVAARGGRLQRERLLGQVLRIFPALTERREALGWQLSGGQQQMLAIGRALMGEPRLLLLDEPSLGLSPKLVDEVLGRIRTIVAGGVAVLLAEQNVAKALAHCDRAYVVEVGRVALSGSSDALRGDPAVRKAYLGG